MVLFSYFLFFICIVILVYNIIPSKNKEIILLKRIKKKKSKTDSKKKEPIKNLVEKFINYLEIKTQKWDNKYLNSYKDNLKIRIQKAGNPNGISADRLFAMQIGCMIGLVLFYIFILYFLLEVVDFDIIYLSLAVIIGFIFPTEIWLKDIIKKRTKAILRSLPDVIDLLTLCVEAGLDFSASIKKIIDKGKQGSLRDEFVQYEKETNMGAARVEALRNMAKRNDIDDLNSFLVALIQAVKMGTSLGPVLRAQSMQIRIKRSQRAEKLAAEAPIKMLGPLIICIFPTVFIVLFAPIIMQLLNLK